MATVLQMSVPESLAALDTPMVREANAAVTKLSDDWRGALTPDQAFGLEARLVLRALQRPLTFPQRQLLQQSFLRPAPEPAILSYWQLLGTRLPPPMVIDLATCLTGQLCSPRTVDAFSGADESGRSVVYPQSCSEGKALVPHITIVGAASPFFEACVHMLEVLLAHPFADGNGRLSRALFYTPFIQCAALSAPCIPLGPAMKMAATEIVSVVREVGTGGSVEPFVSLMGRLLLFTVAEVRALIGPMNKP